jgi:outer membrane protein
MKHFILLYSLTLFFALFNQADAQESAKLSLSLKQAQDYAIENNLNMKNAKLDIEIAKKKIWETKSMGLPQISATGSYQHLFTVPELSFGGMTTITDARGKYTYSAAPTGSNNDSVYLNNIPGAPIKLGVKDNATLDINVSQLIFSGEYIVGLQATKVFYQISQLGILATTFDLKESVANSYYLVLVLERNKDILSQSLTNLSKTYAEMQEMYKQGFIENTDVDQIELTMHTLENGIKTIENQVTASSDLLKFQLGIQFETSLTLTDNLEDIINSADITSIISKQFQVENNINYKILENQEAVGQLMLKRQKSAYLPNLAAYYRHSEKLNTPDFDFAPKDVAGLSMNIPLFSSGQRNVMLQQRVMELEKIRNSKSNATQGLQLDFITSRNALNAAYDKLQNEKRNIELTNRIYEKTLIKYKEGVSSSIDLTTAQTQYLNAQGNYFTALYTLLSSKNKLEKLLNIQ